MQQLSTLYRLQSSQKQHARTLCSLPPSTSHTCGASATLAPWDRPLVCEWARGAGSFLPAISSLADKAPACDRPASGALVDACLHDATRSALAASRPENAEPRPWACKQARHQLLAFHTCLLGAQHSGCPQYMRRCQACIHSPIMPPSLACHSRQQPGFSAQFGDLAGQSVSATVSTESHMPRCTVAGHTTVK